MCTGATWSAWVLCLGEELVPRPAGEASRCKGKWVHPPCKKCLHAPSPDSGNVYNGASAQAKGMLQVPYAFDLLGKRLVLWRDGEGQWRCFEDKCPHRYANLSMWPCAVKSVMVLKRHVLVRTSW